MVTKTIARDLSVTLSGWRLDNPVIPASGTFGFGNEFRDSCLVDGIHPNDIGHMRMGVVIGDVIEKALKNRK